MDYSNYDECKLQINEWKTKSKELGLVWHQSWLNNICLEDLEESPFLVEVDQFNDEQLAKDQEKLYFIRSLCGTKGEFVWTQGQGKRQRKYLSKTLLNTRCDKYQVIYVNGKKHNIRIIAYNMLLGWLITDIHKPFHKDEETKKPISGTTCLNNLIQKVPSILNYRSPKGKEQEYRDLYASYWDTDRNYCFSKLYDPIAEGKILHNVWSIDINSAFGYALTVLAPETRPIILELYRTRKQKPSNKFRMLYTIGAMASKKTIDLKSLPDPVEYAFSSLAKDVVNFISNMLYDMVHNLEEQGASIISVNTDSVKFIWTKPYPPININIGPHLGQWKLEYQNSPFFQAYSPHKYQYIDPKTGQLVVKLSGRSDFDEIEVRDRWKPEYLSEVCLKGWKFDEDTFEITWVTKGEK